MKMKDSIKRAQSRAGSSFAERKNFGPMAKFFTILALFCMTAAGAWAETETISTASDLWQGAKTFTGTNVTVSVESGGNENGSYVSSIYTMNISVTGDNIITGLVLTIGYNSGKAGYLLAQPGKCTASGSGSHSTFVTVTDIDASSVTMVMDEYAVYVEKVEVTYANPYTPTPVANTTNKWKFLMPAGDVELQVEYYPGMLTLGGDAIEGGTVEVVGLTDDALPAGFEKDAEGNIYVAEGTTFTLKAVPEEGYHFVCWSDDAENTDPEREITMPADGSDLSLTAIFAENEYDITFSEGTNPDPENPEWTATPNPAKTKQTVTVTYTGSKKVIGVKAEKKAATPSLNITNPVVGQVIGSDGKNYAYGSLPTGVTAVALIAKVSGTSGLAIALADEEGTMNYDTAVTTAAAHTPAFTGGTWRLPTQDEWKQMFASFGGNDASYSGLNTAITAAGGTGFVMYSNYCSSTESGSNVYYANCSLSGVSWQNGSKTFSFYVRPCLAF